MAPALGFASGAVSAIGAFPAEPWSWWLVIYPAAGALMAAMLNAVSNGLNQIYNLEIDRINKPRRPLPTGRISRRGAWVFTWSSYAVAWTLAWLVAPGGRHECFWIVVIATAMTFLYSAPPRLGIWAKRDHRHSARDAAQGRWMVGGVEPWYIGAIFGLFLLGASTTKDFADMEGDRLSGCRTLPIICGVKHAA